MTDRRASYRDIGRICFVVVLFVAAVFLFWKSIDLLLILFCSVLLAILLDIAAGRLTSLLPIPRGAAVIAVALFIVAAVGIGAALLGPSLGKQGTALIENLTSFAKSLEQKVMSIDAIEEQVDKGSMDLAKILPSPAGFLGGVTAVLGTTLGALANTVLIAAFAIYFALSPVTYINGALSLIPERHRDRARDVLDEMGLTLRQWLAGTALLMVVLGIASYMGLLLIGVPLALLLGVIAGATAFIPIVGPAIAGGLMMLVALSESWQMALWALGLYLSLQIVESYLLTPMIQSKAVDLPAALVIAAQVLFGILFGVLGVALATPIAAVLAVAVKRLYIEDVLGDSTDAAVREAAQ